MIEQFIGDTKMNRQEYIEYTNGKLIVSNDVCEIYYYPMEDVNHQTFYKLMVFPKGKVFKYQAFYTKSGSSFDDMVAYATELADKEIERKLFEKSRLVKVGDLMVSFWGHEQTNVTYYQVVGLKGKCSAVIREIDVNTQKTATWGVAKVTPIKDKFIGDVITVRVKGDSAKVNSYETARLEKFTGAREITTYA